MDAAAGKSVAANDSHFWSKVSMSRKMKSARRITIVLPCIAPDAPEVPTMAI
jgi:hypothetical protein